MCHLHGVCACGDSTYTTQLMCEDQIATSGFSVFLPPCLRQDLLFHTSHVMSFLRFFSCLIFSHMDAGIRVMSYCTDDFPCTFKIQIQFLTSCHTSFTHPLNHPLRDLLWGFLCMSSPTEGRIMQAFSRLFFPLHSKLMRQENNSAGLREFMIVN